MTSPIIPASREGSLSCRQDEFSRRLVEEFGRFFDLLEGRFLPILFKDSAYYCKRIYVCDSTFSLLNIASLLLKMFPFWIPHAVSFNLTMLMLCYNSTLFALPLIHGASKYKAEMIINPIGG